jgi:hypothetical protein
MATSRRKGSYGVDAPLVLLIGVVFLAANLMYALVSRSPAPLIGAAIMAACVACWLYTTRRGKFVVWASLLDRLGLKGDERVLDLGCGRGAAVIGFGLHDGERGRRRHRGAVGEAGGQRIVDVHHLQDARGLRDLFAAQPVRIARAVDPLVMMADDRQDESQRA